MVYCGETVFEADKVINLWFIAELLNLLKIQKTLYKVKYNHGNRR